MSNSDSNIGEGDRESARRYNEDTRDFVENELPGQEKPDASKASTKLTDAEKKARERAKEHDPQVTRDYSRPANDE